jgi:prophage antirepressor-like protein
MNELLVKEFDTSNIRVYLGDDGEPWFITQDVIGVLGIKNQRHALRKLKDEQRGGTIITTPGGKQEFSTVNESGLYALVFQSRTEGALRFQNWITEEVLPSIRKTGSYSLVKKEELSPLDILENHVRHMRRLEESNKDLSEQVKVVAIEARQDHDTLDHDQIKELGSIIEDLYDVRRDYKDLSRARKIIKMKFGLNGSNTWKEIPRYGFNEAKKLILEFRNSIGSSH